MNTNEAVSDNFNDSNNFVHRVGQMLLKYISGTKIQNIRIPYTTP